MEDIRMGYNEPEVTADVQRDGSTVYGVYIRGDYEIQLTCIDEQSADNLRDIWHHSVSTVEIR